MKNRKIIEFVAIVLSSFLLFGCSEKNDMKEWLQGQYDTYNPQGNAAICYMVGYNISYPYLAEPINIYPSKERNQSATDIYSSKLTLFEAGGLLTSTNGIGRDGKEYPLYDLTEEGQKDLLTLNMPWQSVTKNESGFCFGKRIIEEVTSIEDKTSSGNWDVKRTETIIRFTYRIVNVPDWVKTPALSSILGYYQDENRISEGQVWLTKKNGNYYNESTGTTIGTRFVR